MRLKPAPNKYSYLLTYLIFLTVITVVASICQILCTEYNVGGGATQDPAIEL